MVGVHLGPAAPRARRRVGVRALFQHLALGSRYLGCGSGVAAPGMSGAPVTLRHLLSQIDAKTCCLSHQNGFIQGRLTTDNILEVDTVARSLRAQRGVAAAAVFIDQEKAFVAMAHPFIFGALRRMGCPTPVVTLMDNLYFESVTIIRLACREVGRFRIIRGIRQGCPASGGLRAIAFEGVLRTMALVFRGEAFQLVRGRRRLCPRLPHSTSSQARVVSPGARSIGVLAGERSQE